MTQRECGSCTLCCTLMPIKEIGKGANRICNHQTLKGCSIYHKLGFPLSCRLWSCRWLTSPDTANLMRPDEAGYVIDMVPDHIVAQTEEGLAIRVPAIQVWCDPARPEAWRDPAFLAWLEKQEGHVALIRYDERKAIMVAPPAFTEQGEWLEVRDGMRVMGEADVPSA